MTENSEKSEWLIENQDKIPEESEKEEAKPKNAESVSRKQAKTKRQLHNPLADLMMRRIKISAVFWSCSGFSKPMLLESGGFGNRRFWPKPMAENPLHFRPKKNAPIPNSHFCPGGGGAGLV